MYMWKQNKSSQNKVRHDAKMVDSWCNYVNETFKHAPVIDRKQKGTARLQQVVNTACWRGGSYL